MDSFGARGTLTAAGRTYEIFRLQALGKDVERLPYCWKVLLENLLRHEDGKVATADDVRAVLQGPKRVAPREIGFVPARVVLQDFTGVPCVVDLAAMREATAALGGDPKRVNPLVPVELVIDHSIQVDAFGSDQALALNKQLDYARNRERYAFLRWGQQAFRNFKVVPPATGIVHQVNLEHLARVVFTDDELRPSSVPRAYPDTVVGTDSHTTMINGLGVLGWGVGGIEAEAAMLGQPIAMLLPEVLGFRLSGALPPGTTATDLVLTVTQILRKHGVVGKLVEFYGPGLDALSLADRATIGNMAPEYGATAGIFPIDDEVLRYLRLTGRSDERIALVEAYAKEQGMWRGADPEFKDSIALDLSTIEPSVAGPKRPQDRVALKAAARSFRDALPSLVPAGRTAAPTGPLTDGAVVVAAITSCTNTSNPDVLVAAGLLARKAVAKGLTRKPWVKTSLAPGSQVVTRYLDEAGLTKDLDALGFHLVGYGCTTCIGNSGPLPDDVQQQVDAGKLVVASVLSGNRNFEGRIHPDVRANYLMSPPLVVAYALAGRVDVDLTTEPLGTGTDGAPVYLKDVWPTEQEVRATVARAVRSDMFRSVYADAFAGDEAWRSLPVPAGDLYRWDEASTYVRRPPYFDGMQRLPTGPVADVRGARALAVLGDSITTDHISPAGSIKKGSPAAAWLEERGVGKGDYNSYGSRRGNHEVMVRGTFANVRLKNALVPGVEGGVTRHLPTGDVLPIADAAVRYAAEGTALVVLAGKEYGSGSSRDWAAKGPYLQGVKAVIAESYERIHRSNLVGMGVLPLQFPAGATAASLGLTGEETFDVEGVAAALAAASGARSVRVVARGAGGTTTTFDAVLRVDTPQEAAYVEHGGILPYVVRMLLEGREGETVDGHGIAGGSTGTSTSGDVVDEASKESFPGSDPPAY
jgi:aconitate hydratase